MSSSVPTQSSKPIPAIGRKWIPVIIAVVVVLLVAIAAATWYSLRDREGTRSHHYLVRIEANTTAEYVVRLPVPVNTSGWMPPYFMQDIEILKGYPVLALGEYEYGTGLEIKASGYVELQWNKVWPESWNEIYGNLTMTTGAEGWSDPGPALAWIFSDSPDFKIYFSYSCINHHMETPFFASGGGPIFDFYMFLNGMGWQQIYIDYGWMLIN